MADTRPPLDGDTIRLARLKKRLRQDDVENLCRALGASIDRSSLSLIENGKVLRPHNQAAIPVLAQVLELDLDQMYLTGEAA